MKQTLIVNTDDGSRLRVRVILATGNDAFQDGNEERECARIALGIARRIRRGDRDGNCIDINGNTVGNWKVL